MDIIKNNWKYPPPSLLSNKTQTQADRGDIKEAAKMIEKVLRAFGIMAEVREINLGPVITQYVVKIPVSTEISRIKELADDLALATKSPTGQINIEAPIPGRDLIGIEVPNKTLEIFSLGSFFECHQIKEAKSILTAPLGLDYAGNPMVIDIAETPHILIGGATGSGKSVFINSFITTFLLRASPAELKLIIIDPRGAELTKYNGIPHLLTPVIVQPEKAFAALRWAEEEIDRRYKLFLEKDVKDFESYNKKAGPQTFSNIVIFIDNLHLLMQSDEDNIEYVLTLITQRGRAAGVHLIMTTSQPSLISESSIGSNILARIAFLLPKPNDSISIINKSGAEKLLGKGDMLYLSQNYSKPIRIQGTFITDDEIEKVVNFIKDENKSEYEVMPDYKRYYKEVDDKDQLFEEAKKAVAQYDRASASLLQRRLGIGYSRAARLLDQLEAAGIVGPAEGSEPREVLISNREKN